MPAAGGAPQPVKPVVPDGLLEAGNIDLNLRPMVVNADDTYSTVRSITITVDGGRAILIPTVVDGKVVTNQQAISHYRSTGENLGTFSTEAQANSYAEQLHKSQAAQYDQRAAAVQYTGKDLANDVALTSQITALSGGTTIDDKALEKILASRIAGSQEPGSFFPGSDNFERARDLAEVIVDALPGDLHNANVANTLDYRPYLKAMDGKKVIFRSVTPHGLPDISKTKVVHTQKWIDKENERVLSDAIVANGGTAPASDTGYTPGKAGVVTAPADANNPAKPQFDENGNWIPTTVDQASGQGMPITGLRGLVQSGFYDLGQLAGDEAKYQQTTDATAFFPVQVRGEGGRTSPVDGRDRQLPDAMSVLDATNYLNGLTPDEITKVQLRMASAGYFDQLPNGGGYLDGDALDKNTVDAWKLLLTDAVKNNQPAYQVLANRATTYREQLRKERLSQLATYDPGSTALVANDYSQSLVGRDLTPDERASLDSHLMRLVSQRAGYIQGSGVAGQGLANTPGGFTEDDIRQSIASDPGRQREQRNTNTQALNYKLKALLH